MRPGVESVVAEVLNSRWVGQGPKVDELEAIFQARYGRPCVLTNSGTAALHLALIVAGVTQKDLVASPVLTCTATNQAILHQGAIPSFCDVQKNSLNISPDAIRQALKYDPIAAVMITHLNGDPCELKEIRMVCDSYGVPLIEDAAQAFGAMDDGTEIGNAGEFVAFSFQAIKHITCGDGGLLVCASEEDAARARKLRWFGIDRKSKREMGWHAWKNGGKTFDIEEVGYKYQMTDIDAAILMHNLPWSDAWLSRRREIANMYRMNLQGVGFFRQHFGSSCWSFPIEVENRDHFIADMDARGIETSIGQVRNDVYTVFGGVKMDLPNMNRIEDRYVYLPIHPTLTDDDVFQVIQAVNSR